MKRFTELSKMNKPMKVRELEFPVYITDYGSFLAEIADEDWVEAPSYSQLKVEVDRVVAARSKQISVPFCQISARTGVRKGTIRGIHASNGGFLVTWDDGTKDSMSRLSTFSEVPSGEIQARMAEIAHQLEVLVKEAKEIEETVPKVEGKEMAERVRQALGQKDKA